MFDLVLAFNRFICEKKVFFRGANMDNDNASVLPPDLSLKEEFRAQFRSAVLVENNENVHEDEPDASDDLPEEQMDDEGSCYEDQTKEFGTYDELAPIDLRAHHVSDSEDEQTDENLLRRLIHHSIKQ
jgi:hypothetical protein